MIYNSEFKRRVQLIFEKLNVYNTFVYSILIIMLQIFFRIHTYSLNYK